MVTNIIIDRVRRRRERSMRFWTFGRWSRPRPTWQWSTYGGSALWRMLTLRPSAQTVSSLLCFVLLTVQRWEQISKYIERHIFLFLQFLRFKAAAWRFYCSAASTWDACCCSRLGWLVTTWLRQSGRRLPPCRSLTSPPLTWALPPSPMCWPGYQRSPGSLLASWMGWMMMFSISKFLCKS